jgi:hypothetical protein
MSTPHVIKLVEGIALPDGYREVTIEKGDSAGRYAVMPDPKCDYCIPSERGFMSMRVQGVRRKQTCGCVFSRLMKFLKPNGPAAISKPMKKTQPGNETKTVPANQHLVRIDEAITKMTNYVTRRDAQIAELKEARDREVDHAIAEMQALRDMVSAMREEATGHRVKAAKYEEHVAELTEQIRLLKQEAAACDDAIQKSGIQEKELAIGELERQHSAKIEAVEGEGLLRRYRRRLAQLQEKRTKLAS